MSRAERLDSESPRALRKGTSGGTNDEEAVTSAFPKLRGLSIEHFARTMIAFRLLRNSTYGRLGSQVILAHRTSHTQPHLSLGAPTYEEDSYVCTTHYS